MCPADNNATILIILDEPQFEEYIVKNETELEFHFSKWDQSSKKDFESPVRIQSKFKAPFVWNYRDNLIKRVCIYLEDTEKVLSIDKCTEGEEYI